MKSSKYIDHTILKPNATSEQIRSEERSAGMPSVPV